jgi:hypothetical protein
MAKHEIHVHHIEYLAASSAKIGDPPNEQAIVIITVRPDENSFRPDNLSIPRRQAARLCEDLKAVLSRSAVCLLLLLAGAAGCSTEVEVEQETTSPRVAGEPQAQAAVTKERTRVAVDLLNRGMVMEDGQAMEAPFDGVLTVNGCLHIHETLIIHLNENDRASERTAVTIVREWTDEGCERHRRK